MKTIAGVVLMLVFVASASLGDDSRTRDLQLIDAARDGDLGAVKALIAAGADPNAMMDGYPVLQNAVRNSTAENIVEIVETLLAAGADVNGFGKDVPGCCQDRDTALHQAVRYWPVCKDGDPGHCKMQRTKVIHVLLAAGADVHARDKLMDNTPVEWAARWGFSEVVGLLVRAGGKPGAQ